MTLIQHLIMMMTQLRNGYSMGLGGILPPNTLWGILSRIMLELDPEL